VSPRLANLQISNRGRSSAPIVEGVLFRSESLFFKKHQNGVSSCEIFRPPSWEKAPAEQSAALLFLHNERASRIWINPRPGNLSADDSRAIQTLSRLWEQAGFKARCAGPA